jgi:hypothetical protein
MRFLTQALFLLVWATWVCQAQAGIRCGNDLISVGETSFAVQIKLENCGSVIAKEQIGTSTETTEASDAEVAEEHFVERWFIRVKERGGTYCYPLTFEQGLLREIGTWRKCQ